MQFLYADKVFVIMGAHKSIHAGKAKLDIGVNFIHNLCSSYVLSPPRLSSSNPFSLAAGRYPRPLCLGQKCLILQHSASPEIRIHGIPMNNFSHSTSRGVRLSKLSIGMDINEPSTSNWSSITGVYFKHFHFRNDGGRSISRDLDGFPVTSSGDSFDNMLVINQESRFEDANDHGFSHFSVQMQQGIPLGPNLLTFNRFKFFASKGVKLGPALFTSWLSGGSIVGPIAPHQAFAIGGPSSVRGYGEGAVGSGQSCLVSKSELAVPLNKKLTGVIFLDCGSDLRSSHKVPGNPGLRQGKPGSGYGIGYGVRFKTNSCQINVDYAINAFHQRTVYFGISNLVL
ncbi:outer envelope protein 39, chloroplastic-like isoform X2 [Lotus japonicus]|uniref:outer envelope protein 39, chloroplastic-like isoform X2 n=1 Tax=Lotus japonicus TaxID=34305 RepID=UPI002582B8BC|nr:outer envelope protein 39, chloroplastic-like isoform X2 [Lotus japonicus]